MSALTAASVPATLPSTSRGTTTIPRTGQSCEPHSMSLRLATCWRPVRMTFSAYWRTSRLWCSASPSQASGTQSEPVIDSASVSSSVRR